MSSTYEVRFPPKDGEPIKVLQVGRLFGLTKPPDMRNIIQNK